MKKYLMGICAVVLFCFGFVFALDLQSALNSSNEVLSSIQLVTSGLNTGEDAMIRSLYEKGLTVHKDWISFNPEKSIRRDEAAKMLTLSIPYIPAKNSIKKADGVSCVFSDRDDAWYDLRDLLVTSCENGLFKGSNGKFNPQNSITNAQLLTVLGRMLYGMQDESGSHYANKYVSLLQKDGYLEGVFLPESKWDVAAERGMLAKLLVRVIEQ